MTHGSNPLNIGINLYNMKHGNNTWYNANLFLGKPIQ